MAEKRIVTAALLVIGDEILSGRTKDQNIGYVAEYLTRIGLHLREVRVVADAEADIVEALNALRSRFDYVFTTGGIGPTHDDITADSVAKAFGVSIDISPEARALLEPYLVNRGLTPNDARMRMARVPDGARLVRNSLSIAPGFMLGNVVVLAGVPAIMQVMLDDAAQYLVTGLTMMSETIRLSRPEGDIAELFATHQHEFPDVGMGSYPSFSGGRLSTELVLRSIDAERLAVARQGLETKLHQLGYL